MYNVGWYCCGPGVAGAVGCPPGLLIRTCPCDCMRSRDACSGCLRHDRHSQHVQYGPRLTLPCWCRGNGASLRAQGRAGRETTPRCSGHWRPVARVCQSNGDAKAGVRVIATVGGDISLKSAVQRLARPHGALDSKLSHGARASAAASLPAPGAPEAHIKLISFHREAIRVQTAPLQPPGHAARDRSPSSRALGNSPKTARHSPWGHGRAHFSGQCNP